MKRICVILLATFTLFSASKANAAWIGAGFSGMFSADSPYTYMMEFISYPIDLANPVQRVGLALDVTDRITLLAEYSDFSASPRDYPSSPINSTGYTVGGHYRLSVGTLSPVIGIGGQFMHTVAEIPATAPDPGKYLIDTVDIFATFGVEWTIVPNALLLLDFNVVEVFSGSALLNTILHDGEILSLDKQSRYFRSGTVGFRWYFF